MDQCNLLFVYGSLKRSYKHQISEYLSKKATFIGEGKVPGRLYKIEWYPGAIYEPESPHFVHGDIYEIKSFSIFSILDDYEGITGNRDDIYKRTIVDAWMDNVQVPVWFYNYIGSIRGLQMIESGNFQG